MIKWQYGERLISEELCKNEKTKFNILLGICLLIFIGSWAVIDTLSVWGALLLAITSISLPLWSFFYNQSLAQQLIVFEAAEAKYQEKKQALVVKIEEEL